MEKGKKKKAAGTELGVCINCGLEKSGKAASKDLIISSARSVRSFLHLSANHTVCCRNCAQDCEKKRAGYEKRCKDYRLYAIIFFVVCVAGGFSFSGAFPGVLLPAALGSVFIFLLPMFSYFPSFGK